MRNIIVVAFVLIKVEQKNSNVHLYLVISEKKSVNEALEIKMSCIL